MRIERVVVDDGTDALVVELHPRMTVISGPGATDRRRVTGFFVRALGRAADGTHVEIIDATGRSLVVFRPHGASNRVLDSDTGADLTAEYTAPDGTVDLLGQLGLGHDDAHRAMRLGADDLARELGTAADPVSARLAALDQATVWKTANDVLSSHHQLVTVAGTNGALARMTTYADIDRAHARTVRAEEAHRVNRNLGLSVSGLCAVGAVPLWFADPWTAQWLAVVSVAVAGLTVADARRPRRVRADEERSLRKVQARSYAEHRRNAGPLADAQFREQAIAALTAHREASARWTELVGDVSVTWAMQHREAIVGLARKRAAFARSGQLPDDITGRLADLARVVHDRVRALSARGRAGESLPLLLDEPFGQVTDQSELDRMLDAVVGLTGNHQVVLLTANPAIEIWAANRAMTGIVGLSHWVTAATTPAEPEHETQPVAA